jgi:hypothetical protein
LVGVLLEELQPLRPWHTASAPLESATELRLQSPAPQLADAVLSPALVVVAQPWSPQLAEADLSPELAELEQLSMPDRHMPRSSERCPVVASRVVAEHSPNAPEEPQEAPAPSRPVLASSGASRPVAARSCSVWA